MATNVSNNVRIGRVRVYVAPPSTADPVVATMPTGAWVYMGWMADATALLATVTEQDLNVDDLITPVDVVLSARMQGIQGSFAEFVLPNVAIIWGGTLSAVAAGTGAAGYDELTVKGSDDISRKAVLVEQQDAREVPGGTSLPIGRLRVFFPNATVAPNGNADLSRKRQSALPFSIRGHPALDGSEIISIARLITAVGT